jgi:hypothetical protein
VLAGYGILPYSPRWLISKGRDEEALATLQRLHSKKGDNDHILAREEWYLIKKQLAVDATLNIRPFELVRGESRRFMAYPADPFLGKVNLKRTGVACLNMFLAQLVGPLRNRVLMRSHASQQVLSLSPTTYALSGLRTASNKWPGRGHLPEPWALRHHPLVAKCGLGTFLGHSNFSAHHRRRPRSPSAGTRLQRSSSTASADAPSFLSAPPAASFLSSAKRL